MKLKNKFITFTLFLVIVAITLTGLLVLNNVEKQNINEADLKISDTLTGVKRDLEQLKSEYEEKVNAFASAERIALPTYILEKYKNYDYFTPSVINELKDSILESTLLFNLALDFDEAQVRSLNRELIVAVEGQRQISESLVLNKENSYQINKESVMFLKDGNKLLLQAQAPIMWKDKEVASLLLKKYIDESYLISLQKAQGINISISADNNVLVSTMGQSLPDAVYRDNIFEGIIRDVEVQGEKYSFGYYDLNIENVDRSSVIVGLPMSATAEKLSQTREDFILALIISILLVAILVNIYARKLIRPVEDIIAATDELKEGNLKNKINYQSNDELGKLVNKFNNMADSLQEYRDNLFELKEFQENILESIKEAMVVIDRKNKVQTINAAMEQYLNKDRKFYLEKEINEMDIFENLNLSFWETIKSDQKYTVKEYSFSTKNKNHIFNLKIYPLNNNYKLTGAVIILEEITQKVELEKQLLLNDKLSSIGRFTAGIAHEINNPLGTISNFVETILFDEEDQKKIEYLKSIRSEAERISSIVNGLLNFSRQSKSEFGLVDIREVIELSLKICHYQKNYKEFKIVKEYPEDNTYIMGNFNQIQQVFINIITNAFQSMEKGDKLNILVRVTAEQNLLKIIFKDNGSGIESQYLQKIFDPFFTTREEGKGVGLGLSISYGIIKNHGGDITVESEAGKGSTFVVSLPIYKYKENI
ncbi:MAG: ATP-binding protein [Halanaerobiales bacterium]|nr:ATP-binding protein [Halanaerobiales bacterium]